MYENRDLIKPNTEGFTPPLAGLNNSSASDVTHTELAGTFEAEPSDSRAAFFSPGHQVHVSASGLSAQSLAFLPTFASDGWLDEESLSHCSSQQLKGLSERSDIPEPAWLRIHAELHSRNIDITQPVVPKSTHIGTRFIAFVLLVIALVGAFEFMAAPKPRQADTTSVNLVEP